MFLWLFPTSRCVLKRGEASKASKAARFQPRDFKGSGGCSAVVGTKLKLSLGLVSLGGNNVENTRQRSQVEAAVEEKVV